jgi:nicotinamide mononucleotide transporter
MDYYLYSALGQVELAAAVASILCVYLLGKQSIWNFLWGGIGVILYAVVFYEVKLYSDLLLQLAFFLPLQFYGAYVWLFGGQDKTEKIITKETNSEWTLYFGGAISIWGGLFYVMASYTDAAVPHLDAVIAAVSIVAQLGLSHKKLNNWLLWMGMDIFATWLFYSRGLYVTSGLYFFFFFLAGWGYLQWRKDYKLGVLVNG